MPSSDPAEVDAIAERIRDYMADAERKREWRRWVADLRSAHPPSLPVRVVRRPMKRNHGLTGKRDDHFLITIDSALPNFVAWIILLHEWAHALAWNAEPREIDHNDAWGISHALLWRDNHGDADYTPE